MPGITDCFGKGDATAKLVVKLMIWTAAGAFGFTVIAACVMCMHWLGGGEFVRGSELGVAGDCVVAPGGYCRLAGGDRVWCRG